MFRGHTWDAYVAQKQVMDARDILFSLTMQYRWWWTNWYVVLQPIHKYNKTSNFDVMVQWCCTDSSQNSGSLSNGKRTDNSCSCSTCGESTPKILRRSQWGFDRKQNWETN